MRSSALKKDQVYFNAYLPGLLPPRNQPTLRMPNKRVGTLILFGRKISRYIQALFSTISWVING